MEVVAILNNFQNLPVEMIFQIIKCSNRKVDFKVEVLQIWLSNNKRFILKINKRQNLN